MGMWAALLDGAGLAQGEKLWIAMIQSDQSWHWSNGKPYRYLNWDSGERHFLSQIFSNQMDEKKKLDFVSFHQQKDMSWKNCFQKETTLPDLKFRNIVHTAARTDFFTKFSDICSLRYQNLLAAF